VTISERAVRIERIFNAERARVWRAFTEPELLAQWWGRGHHVDIVYYEFHVGGRWRFVETTDDGPQGFEGLFREIASPERLEQTFQWDGASGHIAVMTTILEDLGDGRTRLLGLSSFPTTDERDAMMRSGMEDGVNQSYAALDRLLNVAALHIAHRPGCDFGKEFSRINL
jgi:uncharacterized protein YndB with AHSA1/START domain